MIRYVVIIAMLLLNSLSYAQTLDDYFKTAAENNPGLQATYKEYKAALQKVPQVHDLPDPTFSFGYFISPVETRVGPQQIRLSLTQIFPWFGTLKALANAEALLAEAKFQSFIDARNKLYLQVAAAYYPLYELNDWKRFELENINLLETYKNISTQKFKNGKGTMVDVLRVEMMLKDAQTNLNILRKKEKILVTIFNKLLDRSANEKVVVKNSLLYEELPANFRKDSLMAANPKLKALDLKIQASRASEMVAKKQGFPKLGVGIDYTLVGERKDLYIPDNGKDILMPMLSIRIPVFRKKYDASVKETQLMQKSYLFQKQEVTNRLVSEYELVWFEIQQQEELLILYDEQIKTTQQSLNLLFTSYGNSGKEFEEVLRMQQQLLKYKKLKASTLAQYYIAVSKINYLTSKSY